MELFWNILGYSLIAFVLAGIIMLFTKILGMAITALLGNDD
jgi:hypothetical protein